MHRTEGLNFTKDNNGNNVFTNGPPATTIEDRWLNAIQEEICNVITHGGLEIKDASTDSVHTQLRDAIINFAGVFSTVIASQLAFNNCIERVAANQYKIKDDYTSLYLKYVTGGYACFGSNSFLSDGDTWGYLDTNNCKLIQFENGAYLFAGDTPFYLRITGVGCGLIFPSIKGSGVTDAAVQYSYYIATTGVRLLMPKVVDRYTNTDYVSFYSSSEDSEQNIVAPVIDNITETGGSITRFYQCLNVVDFYWNVEKVRHVNTQSDFNLLFERVAANQYKFRDGITTVKMGILAGGYQISGILSGGDTWGYIQTNNCVKIECEPGAYFDWDDMLGYLETNTDDCVLDGVDIRGDGITELDPSGTTYSFKLNAMRVTYRACKTSARKINSTAHVFVGFYGSTDSGQRDTSSYERCMAYELGIDGATTLLTGFYKCSNLSNCVCYEFDDTGSTAANIYAVYDCRNVSNHVVYDFDSLSTSGSIIPFSDTNGISNAYVYDIDGGTDVNIAIFDGCSNLSGCEVKNVDATGTGYIYGFWACTQVVGCKIDDFDGADIIYGYYDCRRVSACYVTDCDTSDNFIGVYQCYDISACEVYACSGYSVYGFNDCHGLVGGYVSDISGSNNTYGFYYCYNISGCEAISLTGSTMGNTNGYYACECVSSCKVYNITSAEISPIVIVGFNGCRYVSGCNVYGVSNTSSGDAHGFRNCDVISACEANQITSSSGTAEQFHNCTYGAALYTGDTPASTGNDYIDTADAQITHKVSTPDIFT
jgi:hypothetical protein